MAPKKGPKRTNKPSPLERMREAFEIVNLDADGEISKEEFVKAMAAIGIDETTATKIFKKFDPDGSGQLDSGEFFDYAAKGGGELKDIVNRSLGEAEDQLAETRKIFETWDADGSGSITADELERVLILLNPSFKKTDMKKIMKKADKNGDGQIDFNEFCDWLNSKK
eukprot:TRINITY_DN12534_c0_g1_i1.p1 TRINITY_DN12534_c0_g1~~TRINITY_DN12534_c0_g1_i1.p1  ORF type:complete len:167 (+),score=59.00 TRINITY_DN12534_c0_g1_i1:94-594(+)